MSASVKSATLSEIRRRMRDKDTCPYKKCIDQLNKMDASIMHTPLEKMNCIAEISSCIKQEVQKFWRGVEVDKRKLTLDAE